MLQQLALALTCFTVPSLQTEFVQETFPDQTRIEYEVRSESDGTQVRDGDYQMFDANDVLRVSGKYKDGDRSGRWTYAGPEGKTRILGKYSKGTRHGSWLFKDAEQATLAKGKYKWGSPAGEWILVDNQGVERRGEFERATMEHPDGSLAGEGTVFDGVKHGRWTFYWENGRKQVEVAYFDGERTGPMRFWHSDGTADGQMLRADYGARRAVRVEFYEDPTPEYSEPQQAPVTAAIPNPNELAPVAVVEDAKTAHGKLRAELAEALEQFRSWDYTAPDAWSAAQTYMDHALADVLCGHRLVAANADPGPATTGLAIIRLHSLYRLTAESPDLWFIDLNHANHGQEAETCPTLLNPTFDGDGLQAARNRRSIYALRFRPDSAAESGTDSRATDKNLALALEWLVNNQADDGAWLAEDPFYSTGVTGLALLALMADGNTLREGPHQEAVRRGVSFLIERPHPALEWKPNPKRRRVPASSIPEEVSWVRNTTFLYTLAIKAQVYSELAALSDGPLIRELAKATSDLCLEFRNPDGAWGYAMEGMGTDDTSLSCWMVAALLAAERAGLEVDPAYRADTLAWFDEATELMFGRTGYRGKDQLSSREVGVNEHYPRDLTEALTAAALWARFALGLDPEEVDVMERSADTLLRCLPAWDPVNGLSNDCYYWYYATHALAYMGGEYERAWTKALNSALVGNQDMSKAARGSWANSGPWGSLGGRPYSTALLALCLAANSRYDLAVR